MRVLSDIVKRRSFRANGHGVRANLDSIEMVPDSHDSFALAPTSWFRRGVFPHPSEGIAADFLVSEA